MRDPRAKILPHEELFRLRRQWRAGGKVVVFTNGCFDLLHRGHAEYLAAGRALGDLLIVGLNTDSSAAQLKGPGRPLVQEEDRAYLIASLEAVDYVVLFADPTPRRLIAQLEPDILVKGGDYRPEAIVGREEVEQTGGRVVTLPLLEGRSTSELIAKIAQHFGR